MERERISQNNLNLPERGGQRWDWKWAIIGGATGLAFGIGLTEVANMATQIIHGGLKYPEAVQYMLISMGTTGTAAGSVIGGKYRALFNC